MFLKILILAWRVISLPVQLLVWFLKPKKRMAKIPTKRKRLWKYTISSHAQNEVADPTRNLRKLDVPDNLLRKPLGFENGKISKEGRLVYRVGRWCTLGINPDSKVVINARKASKKERRKYGN